MTFSPDRPRVRHATDHEKGLLTELGFKIDHAEWNGHVVPDECHVYLRFFDFVRTLWGTAMEAQNHNVKVESALVGGPTMPREWWRWLDRKSLESLVRVFHAHQRGLPTKKNYQGLFALFAEQEIRGKLVQVESPGPLPKSFYLVEPS